MNEARWIRRLYAWARISLTRRSLVVDRSRASGRRRHRRRQRFFCGGKISTYGRNSNESFVCTVCLSSTY